MADRIETHLIVKAVAKGFDKVAKEHKKVGDEAKKQKGVLKGLKDNWMKVGAAMMGVMVAIKGLKKVWDFAEQGAAVRQQAESFDFMMDKIGVTTDILGELREASRGTVDDMTLMSGTATLLAGAGDELAKKLAEATPQLMEIAKASNKLNPSLGTTAFMYESIATGIKRAQPLILDNLGLTIKVGKANKDYADKLGIVVTQLTAEQKAMAMLEAALKAGDNLIGQVGGTTESATDAFARLTTILKNAGDAAKAGLGEALGPVASKLADLIEHSMTLDDIMRSTGITLDDFAGYVNSAGEVIAENDQELIAWYESLGDIGKRVHDISGQFSTFPEIDDGVGDSIEDVGDAAKDAADDFEYLWDVATPDAADLIEGITGYIEYMNSEMPNIVEAVGLVEEALRETEITDAQAKEMLGSLSVVMAGEQVAMGASAKEAATAISSALGIGFQDAQAMLKAHLADPLAAMDGETITIYIRQEISQIMQTEEMTQYHERQRGGQLGRGWTLVGDPGPNQELISPWGWVFDAQTTKKMLEGGMVPGTKRAVAGGLNGGGGGGGGGVYDYESDVALLQTLTGTVPAGDVGGITTVSAPSTAEVVAQSAAVTAPAAATTAAAAVASTVSAAASIQAQAIQAAIAKQVTESKKLLKEMVAVRDAIEDLPDPIGDRVIHGMETLDTR